MSDCVLYRVAAGEQAAVEECLSRYGGLIWSLARRQLPNLTDAEDAVQDIFIDIWRNARRFDERIASEVTFVAMLARRRLIDKRRQQKSTIATLPISSGCDPAISGSENQVMLGEEIARARQQLEQLKPEERNVLELAIHQGLTQTEVAERLNMPLGTVKTNARRGLMRLRELFGQAVGQSVAKGVQR